MLQTPDLMRDRHLDQIIMCCIYVMAKVLRLDITFQEIMRQYRHQPQAKSHVCYNTYTYTYTYYHSLSHTIKTPLKTYIFVFHMHTLLSVCVYSDISQCSSEQRSSQASTTRLF